ncbi:hypothetical protein Ancab_015439 [Ancistrocladus abbreviatus]
MTHILDLQGLLMSKGLLNCYIRPMGGNMVLISSDDMSNLKDFVEDPQCWLHQIFIDISNLRPMPPFKVPPLGDFENLSLSSREKSKATYPYCNYSDSNADAAHDDIGAVVLNASGDEVICPKTSFPDISPRQGKVATTGLLVLGGVPLLTSVLAQLGDTSQSRLPSSPQLGCKKPICKALLATKPKPILAHNHGKNKKVSFSSPLVGPFSQSISHFAKKAETRPNHAPK